LLEEKGVKRFCESLCDFFEIKVLENVLAGAGVAVLYFLAEAVEHLFAHLVDAGLSPYLVGAIVERVKDAPCGVASTVLCKVVVAVRGRHDIDVDEFCVLYVFWGGRVIGDDDGFVKKRGLATGVASALPLADADVAIVQGVYCGDLLFRENRLVDI
jgi:hypothetical protein